MVLENPVAIPIIPSTGKCWCLDLGQTAEAYILQSKADLISRLLLHASGSTCYEAWLAYSALSPELSSLPPDILVFPLSLCGHALSPNTHVALPMATSLVLFPVTSVPTQRANSRKPAFIYFNLAWIDSFHHWRRTHHQIFQDGLWAGMIAQWVKCLPW